MRDDNVEETLRRLFRELRAEDERRAPDSGQFLRAAQSRLAVAPPPHRVGLRLAATFAASLALTAIVWCGRTLRELPNQERGWEALTNWSAPTDALTCAPRTLWGSTIDTVSDAWIGASASTNPPQTAGKEQP